MQQWLLRTFALAALLLFGLAALGALLESAEQHIEALRAKDKEAEPLHDDLAETIVLSRLQNEGVTGMADSSADDTARPAFQYQQYKRELEEHAAGWRLTFSPYEKMSLIYVLARSQHEMDEIRQMAAGKAVSHGE